MLLIMPDQMGIGFVCSILHPTSKEKVLCNLATLYRYIDLEVSHTSRAALNCTSLFQRFNH